MPTTLLNALTTVTRDQPFDRKLLLSRSLPQGREVLRALTLSGVSWIGWEVTTVRRLAHEIAGEVLQTSGLRLIDGFTARRLIDEAIDEVSADGNRALRSILVQPSLRDAIHGAVRVLREIHEPLPPHDSALLDAAVLVHDAYVRRLSDERFADRTGLLRRAIELVSAGAISEIANLWIVPVARHGLAGQLIDALNRQGIGRVLASSTVHGLEAPEGWLLADAADDASAISETSQQDATDTASSGSHHTDAHPAAWLHAPAEAPQHPHLRVDLFAAATPASEVREVLRRVVAAGIAWDQVEIVATDARTYGGALYALKQQLDIPVTFASGIELARTRIGRAVRSYLRWVGDSYPAESLRLMLEAGDIAVENPFNITGARLAQRLRMLRIGWGRERYLPIVEAALHVALKAADPNDAREAQEAESARERERIELQLLRDLLRDLLQRAPAVPPRLRGAKTRTTPATIAQGLLSFLANVPAGDNADASVRDVVRARLERAANELTRETDWESALATIERLIEMRVSAEDDGEPGSRTAQPGKLHFADIWNGGLTGRPHLFVLGLDTVRMGIGPGGDAVVSDDIRARLSADVRLPTSAQLAAERRYQAASLVAAATGSVTLSYAAWDATDGKAVPPAIELLQALRLRERNDQLTYRDLHTKLARLASAVPNDGGRIDAADVWLGALMTEHGVLRSGEEVVRAAYPQLARGLHAQEQRGGMLLTTYHGRILRNATERARPFSATALETLGACPRRYFYRYLLRIEPPEIYEFEPDAWLDPLERGSLFHAVYEESLRSARAQNIAYDDPAFEQLAAALLDEKIEEVRNRRPPPGEAVFQRECDFLHRDLDVFIRRIRHDKPEWLELEYRFGEGDRAVEIQTASGPVRLRGAIDRVDRMNDRRLRVIDYKTGRTYGYHGARPFNGGRRIQHVVYTLAAMELLERDVAVMEYQFPTLNGESATVSYPVDKLGDLERAIDRLVRIARSDFFSATENSRDCTFCNYREVCGVRENPWGGIDSPTARWSQQIGYALPEYEALRTLRSLDD